MEQWRDIVGYEEYYQVSNLGRVQSVDRVVRSPGSRVKRLKGKILQACPRDQRGHLGVNLWENGVRQSAYIHQLVATAWIGPCPYGQLVRHGPNGVTDNLVSNLCYGTPSEDGLDKRRDNTHGGRPVKRSDGVEFINMHVAAEELGCWCQNIWKVCNGKIKTTGGFGWEYI